MRRCLCFYEANEPFLRFFFLFSSTLLRSTLMASGDLVSPDWIENGQVFIGFLATIGFHSEFYRFITIYIDY